MILFAVFVLTIFSNVSLTKIINMPSNFYASYTEIDNSNKNQNFGKFVKLNYEKNDMNTDNSKEDDGVVIFKLFGFIPIKKIKVKLLPEDEVYVGGVPVGMTINTDGAVVVSEAIIDLKNPKIEKNSLLKNGDLITSIDGNEVKNVDDIERVLNSSRKDKVSISFIRNNKEKNDEITLIKDEEGQYKLGVWVKDDLSGVGTLTFVKKDNKYGALGHAISNGKYESALPMTNGNLYNCSLVGIKKGQKNNPGELNCVFVSKDVKGDIRKNTRYGIYGCIQDTNGLVDENLSTKLGGRLSVKPGKAKIVSSVSGIREEYEIEIIKATNQEKSDDKSIVFRVKDKRLIDLTGGIVQGMSGSPIIQDNKIVGAVTHVFLSDPTKGYGVYCDWMVEQMDF